MEQLLNDIEKRMQEINVAWLACVDQKDTNGSGQMWARFQELDTLKKRLEKELGVPKDQQTKLELKR